MTDREKFQKTFDALQAPDSLLDSVLAQTERPRQHRWTRTALIAACLVLLLTITILADAPDALVTRANAQPVFQQEWQSLHDAGAFVPDIDPAAWKYRQENQTDHFLCFHWEVDPNFYFTSDWTDGYHAWATLDSDSGKITDFHIEAGNHLMHTDWEPVKTVTPEQQEAELSVWDKCVRWLEVNLFGIEHTNGIPPTLKWYDHYELLIDSAMTAGQFGEIWREYAGYSRFEVLGMDPDMTVVSDLFPFESSVYFAFQRPAGLYPVYMKLTCHSMASGVAISFSQISEEDLPEEITKYGYAYGYLLRACNRELSALYDLGLFREPLQFTAEDYAPSNPSQSGMVSTNWKTRTKDDPHFHIQWNPATNQILYLSVSVSDGQVLPEGLTLGALCDIWTEYDKSFDRYELPDGAAETPVTLITTLPDWHHGVDGTYYPVAFYEPGEDTPSMRYICYERFTTGVWCLTFGTDYPKG